ncbi:hypothetical protein D3C84_428080 [compost metagenome]
MAPRSAMPDTWPPSRCSPSPTCPSSSACPPCSWTRWARCAWTGNTCPEPCPGSCACCSTCDRRRSSAPWPASARSMKAAWGPGTGCWRPSTAPGCSRKTARCWCSSAPTRNRPSKRYRRACASNKCRWISGGPRRYAMRRHNSASSSGADCSSRAPGIFSIPSRWLANWCTRPKAAACSSSSSGSRAGN